MDLLIVESIEDEVVRWLNARHSVRCAPELAHDPLAFRQALRQVRALVLPPSVAIDANALYHAPWLRAVGRVSAGAENIDLDACARAGVEVVRSATATAQAEAEFMIGSLLSLLRRIPVPGSGGTWVGRELGAATVGLIGMSPSARSMATMLKGFGSRVTGYDPSLHSSDAVWQRWRIKPLGLRELLESSDAVCVQLADFSRYRGLLGKRLLQSCKPNQVIVNITHSGVFDEAALAEAMASGRISAARFDSLEPGALDQGRPLAAIDTLQITPRVASTTRESRLRSAWAVARRIDELLTLAPAARRQFRPTAADAELGLEAGPVLP
jgi:D-3-phosphoglycerate dehydrogenase / 2-oxoglutarate reductase